MSVPTAGQGRPPAGGQLQGWWDYGHSARAGHGQLQDSPGKGTGLFSPCDSLYPILKLIPTLPKLEPSQPPFVKKDFYYRSDNSVASQDLFLELSEEAVYAFPEFFSPS